MDPNSLLAILYAIIILILIYTYFERRPYFKIMDQFPTAVNLPLIGQALRVASPTKILTAFRDISDGYENKSGVVFLGPIPIFTTSDPSFLEKIFNHPNFYNKPDVLYGPIRELFGDGLFTAIRAKWQRNRKIINPAFRKPVLRTFVPVFNQNSEWLKRQLNSMIGQGEQNILKMMQKFTMTAAMETVLGYESDGNVVIEDQVVQNYFSVLKLNTHLIIWNYFKLGNLVRYFGFYKTRDAVFEFITSLVKKRIERNQIKTDVNGNTKNEEAEAEFGEKRSIFIDQALKNVDRNLFNWRELIDESNSMIFAAFETTASTLFYTFALLAMHPDIQEKAFEYIKSIQPDKNFDVEYEHIDDYDYLDMIVNETLRHVPPVPQIGRLVAEDTQLKDDIILLKGMVVFISIFHMHRNTNVWGPDAHIYNPEQFSPENVSNRNPYAFLPFSGGPRGCIGKKYAMIAIKIVLCQILRNYRFTTKFKFEDLDFENNIIIRAKEVPLLEVHRRDD